ncbi:uncharacterized protein LOC126846919 isoform X2 [Adelges cooleyi]|uniref:uncharacterized protein LOC126846919 isoform X2 n=1 Tax=Adelges cooleyi TaxID=133065 RepID=UPI00217F5DFB|nr:uncharacterized protein LOC126846919 isoform X2 [Adelges cooleyi]XP_050442746.1 uncharacterized protein LOC126846919 isoform X2 [Adelges cooleyi]XP_050442747.1 uncharacterized protein LOC126846919 isoform X2 [Adelges cooleyi]
MKRVCVLLPLVFVSVLAGRPMSYEQKVYSTNIIIANAEHVFPQVLRKIVRENQSMEELVIMFVVPEKANIENELLRYLDIETDLQNEITAALTHVDNSATSSEGSTLEVDPPNSNLITLGQTRRDLTSDVPQRLFHTIESNRTHDEDYKNKHMMCRLKGLVKSLISPNRYIKEYALGDTLPSSDQVYCHLTTILNDIEWAIV